MLNIAARFTAKNPQIRIISTDIWLSLMILGYAPALFGQVNHIKVLTYCKFVRYVFGAQMAKFWIKCMMAASFSQNCWFCCCLRAYYWGNGRKTAHNENRNCVWSIKVAATMNQGFVAFATDLVLFVLLWLYV